MTHSSIIYWNWIRKKWRILELDGETLAEKDADHFQELVNNLAAYWPNPVSAKLKEQTLVKNITKITIPVVR